LVTSDAREEEAIVISIQVAACLVSKVGEFSLVKKHNSYLNNKVSIKVPRRFEEGDPQLCELESIPARM
jgi:hypothetical protein